jgi:2-keto-4-pentenoate hydratase/2-oxohepta-3-ene-1,7-dioic acid hydratase in catechol pathway
MMALMQEGNLAMRLVTYSTHSEARLGAWINDDAQIVDLAAASLQQYGQASPAFASMLSLIDGGASALDKARRLVETATGQAVIRTADCKILAPLPQPLQFRDFLSFPGHVKGCRITTAELSIANAPDPAAKRAEMEAAGFFDVPADYFDGPGYYICNRMAVIGTDVEVQWPAYSTFIDYELEWAAIIGKEAKGVTRDEAKDYIFGYTVFNDWSARDEQTRLMASSVSMGVGGGKDFANSLGPCIVTADEISDPYNLEMRAYVNDELVSTGNTSGMHYRFEDHIEHLNRIGTLYPGEVLGSGTVGGGCSLETRRAVQPGDTITLEVESIGTIRNTVRAPHIAPDPEGGFNTALARMLRAALKA